MAGERPVNLDEYEAFARARLGARPLAWFAGGAGDEWTLRENRAAFARWCLRPRVLVDVGKVRTETTVLGRPVAMPALVAPVAFQQLAHAEGEAATAAGAAAAGTIMCVPTMASVPLAEISAAAPDAPRWFQLYVLTDRGATRELVRAAVDTGVEAIVLTVDAPRRGQHERELASGFTLPPLERVPAVAAALGERRAQELERLVATDVTWRTLAELVAETPVPLLVKGILTREDAALACEAGAAGIVVSNHGGRQLDGVPATLDVLPEVAEAVGGRGEVLLDGGIRRGTDAIKALALGARAVLVGRPAIWGLAADGRDGVAHALELLRKEIEVALALLGCPSPDAVGREHVASAR